jgi:hypothetical protein
MPPAKNHGPMFVDLTVPAAQCPPGSPGLLVTVADPDPGGALEGVWLTRFDWAARADGDVLAVPGWCREHPGAARGRHLQLILVHAGTAHRLGSWCGLGPRWGLAVRETACTVLALHAQLEEALGPCVEYLIDPGLSL